MPAQPRKTPFVTVQLTVPTRDAARLAALNLSAEVARRLSMSDAIAASLAVADRHRAEVVAELARTDQEGADQ